MRERLALGPDDLVVELASNDGYLLQHFVGTRRSRSSASIRPRTSPRPRRSEACRRSSSSSASSSRERLVAEGKRADLVVGNNVLAQVPDLNDFVAGVADRCCAPDGTATFEFPHLLRLLDGLPVRHDLPRALLVLLARHDRRDLRARTGSRSSTSRSCRRTAARFACTPQHDERPAHRSPTRSPSCSSASRRAACGRLERYATVRRGREGVEARAPRPARSALRREGKQVVGYGAPGKGNTLLNYCGIRTDLLDYTVDRNPYKHGLFTPGTHIPIHPPERIAETRPDYVVDPAVEPRRRDRAQLAYIGEWGAS